MDFAGHHPLAGAGLAKQQDRRILGRHLVDAEEDIGDGRALADDLAEALLLGNHLLQLDVLDLKPVGQLLDFGKRLLQVGLRLLALLDFLRESRIGPGQLGCPRLDGGLQLVMGLLQLLLQLPAHRDVDDRGQDKICPGFVGDRDALQLPVDHHPVLALDLDFAPQALPVVAEPL